jgi:hypothetical protein
LFSQTLVGVMLIRTYLWVKLHYLGGGRNVVTLYCFPGVSMFELQPWWYWSIFFQFFLHNMVYYNTNNSIAKKNFFSNLHYEVPKHISSKNIVHHHVLKNANIVKNDWKWFLVFMKFVLSIKHCDSIWLE